MVKLVSSDGTSTFPPLDVPINSTVEQLEALVHEMLNGGGSDSDSEEEGKKKKKKVRAPSEVS